MHLTEKVKGGGIISPHNDLTERGRFISALNALTLSLKGEREVSLNLPLSQGGEEHNNGGVS